MSISITEYEHMRVEALKEICLLCKRLNPHHTGDPNTCTCADTEFLRKKEEKK